MELKISTKLRKKDSVAAGIQRLAYEQYRIIVDNEAGASDGSGPESLHDIRVAARRLRSVLRLTRKLLKNTDAEAIQQHLKDVQTRLGAARDFQVWLRFLETPAHMKRFKNDEGWSEFLKAQHRRARSYQGGTRRIIASKSYRKSLDETGSFIKSDMLDASGGSFVRMARRRIRRIYKNVVAFDAALEQMHPEEIHSVRKKCRRARYWCEFAEPVSGPLVEKLAVRFKGLADVLGDIHDMDVFAERIQAESAHVPAVILKEIKRQRRQFLADFEKAWHKLASKRFQKEVRAGLKK